jgi:hypothetical protein
MRSGGAVGRRLTRLGAVVTAVQAAAVVYGTRALAAPSPSGSPSPKDLCSGLPAPAQHKCESGGGGAGSGIPDVTSSVDPLTSLSKGCADAASWSITELSKAVNKTTQVDFTNTAFLRQYAVVFAASTILTLVLWLLAVAKRAVRGVPFTEAFTEAVGFLWLTVLASAFTPLILYTVVSAVDAVTKVIGSGTASNTDVFFGTFSKALSKGTDIGGGPIMLIIVSLVSVLAAGVLWMELVIRAALLYVGALLGTAVYSGLVDKNMWHHVRRWAGVMIAVILVKPVVVIVLGLADALSTSSQGPGAFSAVVSGLAIILLAIFASFMIYRFVPGFGDDVAAMRGNREKAAGGSQAAAVISSPAALVKQGIKTHSARGGAPQPATPAPAQTGGGISGGVAAHSSRGGAGTPGPGPSAPGSTSLGSFGGGGAPAPRTAPPTGRPAGTGNNSSTGTTGGDRR